MLNRVDVQALAKLWDTILRFQIKVKGDMDDETFNHAVAVLDILKDRYLPPSTGDRVAWADEPKGETGIVWGEANDGLIVVTFADRTAHADPKLFVVVDKAHYTHVSQASNESVEARLSALVEEVGRIADLLPKGNPIKQALLEATVLGQKG